MKDNVYETKHRKDNTLVAKDFYRHSRRVTCLFENHFSFLVKRNSLFLLSSTSHKFSSFSGISQCFSYDHYLVLQVPVDESSENRNRKSLGFYDLGDIDSASSCAVAKPIADWFWFPASSCSLLPRRFWLSDKAISLLAAISA